ncbi:MAG: M81 family metallopeptidase [Alphaproteobacteria bacterium]|nr:M81 family metallopeptidase [Alphaproteobacteria bacterium]
MTQANPRIAICGFSIECNRFAPVATRAHFAYFAGDEIATEARNPAPRMLGEIPGFVADMDAAGPWQPVGAAFAAAEPNGPTDHQFFTELLADIETRLTAALPVDAVYICEHGAGITTEDDDPDGALFATVRRIVGPAVPVVATLDLHANISDRMVSTIDAFIGYRTNPHMDMRERGIEAAQTIRELLAGTKTELAFVRLPVVPPTVTMLTAAGPYADMIDYGQTKIAPGDKPEIMNVSVMGGFAFSDSAKNGLTVVVTARRASAPHTRRNSKAAEATALDVAQFGWDNKERFYPKLTPLADAVARAVAASGDPALPAMCLADVADNPGGGGRGNTMYLLKALYEAKVKHALVGIIYDPELAEEAHGYGLHYNFDARFNRDETTKFSEKWSAPARVVALHDGECVGRRGIYAGMSLGMGKCAALRIGGITVVVVSKRRQCADPMFFEMMGLDIAKARIVVVKSRGHFRGGFDEFFNHEQIVEVDLPGLTSPVLANFEWHRLPRPVIPLDDAVRWQPPQG